MNWKLTILEISCSIPCARWTPRATRCPATCGERVVEKRIPVVFHRVSRVVVSHVTSVRGCLAQTILRGARESVRGLGFPPWREKARGLVVAVHGWSGDGPLLLGA